MHQGTFNKHENDCHYSIDLDPSDCVCSAFLSCGATSELGLRRSSGTTLMTLSCASSVPEIQIKSQEYLLF